MAEVVSTGVSHMCDKNSGSHTKTTELAVKTTVFLIRMRIIIL